MTRLQVLSLLAGVCLTACSDTTLGTKSFTEALDPLPIPGGPIDVGMLETGDIPLDLDLKDQPGYSALSIVTSVKIRSATFTISPDTDNPSRDPFADNNADNFDFLSGVVLSLRATINNEVRTVQVASLPDGDPQIGSNASVLNLVVDDVDIRDYVEAADVQLIVSAVGTVPPDYVIIDPVVSFRVGVGIR